jgi:hypothetical protein
LIPVEVTYKLMGVPLAWAGLLKLMPSDKARILATPDIEVWKGEYRQRTIKQIMTVGRKYFGLDN